jgi:magnesium-protoporphyrin O-methyltransferase
MRATLLEWLPQDLHGKRVLDAGCGTGALAVLAAKRGAEVVAIDLSPTLVSLAKERMPAAADLRGGSIHFLSGDMLNPALGKFDYVVGMDSLIHYNATDAVRVLSGLANRTKYAILFTFAPKTFLLAAMHSVGRLFPRGDRAPAIEPVSVNKISRIIGEDITLQSWAPARTRRIASGFYTSQAMELVRQ